MFSGQCLDLWIRLSVPGISRFLDEPRSYESERRREDVLSKRRSLEGKGLQKKGWTVGFLTAKQHETTRVMSKWKYWNILKRNSLSHDCETTRVVSNWTGICWAIGLVTEVGDSYDAWLSKKGPSNQPHGIIMSLEREMVTVDDCGPLGTPKISKNDIPIIMDHPILFYILFIFHDRPLVHDLPRIPVSSTNWY